MTTQTDATTWAITLGRAKGWRYDLKVELRPKETVAPHQTIRHKPALRITELVYSIDIYNYGHLQGWERGPDAVATLRHAGIILPAQTRKLLGVFDHWHLNGMMSLCAHAPRPRHICPGREYGCACCGNQSEPELSGSDGVYIVKRSWAGFS